MTTTVTGPVRAASARISGALDRLTGRVTMYRLVAGLLAALFLIGVGYAAAGKLPATPWAMVCSVAVLLAAGYLSNRALAALLRVRPHSESTIITGLILYFLVRPTDDPEGLIGSAALAVLASASKYLLAVRRRHVFNPAAVAAVLYAVVIALIWPSPADRPPFPPIGWWIAGADLAPYVLVAAVLVLHRTRLLGTGVVFVVIATGATAAWLVDGGAAWPSAVRDAVFGYYPILFLAGFLLTEPLTLPPLRRQRYLVAAVIGFFFAFPLLFGPVDLGRVSLFTGPEWAILVGNLIAFLCGQRRGVELIYRGRRRLTPTSWELEFDSSHPVRYRAGQYAELTLPHRRADARGRRRVFSFTSAPGAERVRFGIKFAEPGSSYKAALLALEPGDRVPVTTVGGDFVLPGDREQPLVLVAGGIGITPFISQLADRGAGGGIGDVVLVHLLRDASDLPYLDEVAALGVPVTVVAGERPANLPATWGFHAASAISADVLAAVVPDVSRRRAYVSGSPEMVTAAVTALNRLGARAVHTDRFNGY